MDARQSCNERLRVLMLPYLAHSHVFPFLELAKGLAKKNFHIYFCSTPIILESVKQSLSKDKESSSSSMSIELVELHLPSLPDLPPHYHSTKNVPPHLRPTLINAFQMSRSSFSDILKDLEPDLLLYDMMQPWSAKNAAALGIPPVHFAVTGSVSVSFGLHCYQPLQSLDSYPYKAIFLKEFEIRDLSAEAGREAFEVADREEGFFYGVYGLSHEIVLVKSCRGVEGKYIDYLSTLCQKKVVPTGPLITFAGDNQESDSEIINWLSDKRECSTLYMSFGSEYYLSPAQMGEIAKGLELSGVNFIWAARLPVGSEVSIDDALPEGFLQRVEQRGLVVRSWAPQAAILAHPSVGGFLNHCGWGSVTESLYFGVPMVAVPLKVDHPIVARLVVELGVGVEVERDEDGKFDGEAVATAIKEVMNAEESGERFRSKARELSEKMKVEEEEAFDEIAQELSRICAKK